MENTAARAVPLSSRAVPWVGAALAAIVLLAVGSLGWQRRADLIDAERTREATIARVLEDHATRSLRIASIALDALTVRFETLGERSPLDPSSLLAPGLADLNILRSVAVLDETGRVLASSAPEDVGRQVDLARLGVAAGTPRERIGPYVHGRGLAALDRSIGNTAAPRGVAFVPLVRQAALRNGERRIVVGLLNPDAFSTQQQLALGNDGGQALLASYGGQVLATTDGLDGFVGQRLGEHPVFARLLASQELGDYVGEGTSPGDQVVAFRVSRSWPLVVVVEQPMRDVQQRWLVDMEPVMATAAALLAALAVMTAWTWRSARNREATARALSLAQEEIIDRERQLSVTIDSLQELVFRTNAHGAITFTNHHWTPFTGTPREDANGRRFWDFVAPAQRETARALFAHGGTRGVRRLQVSIPNATGSMRCYEVAVTPLVEHTRIVGFAGSALDVTGRVQTQQKLQAQLAFTGLLMETSPVPKSVVDLTGRYLLVNKAWEDFTGHRREDIVGALVGTHLPPHERAVHRRRDEELIASGVPMHYEAVMTHRDGSRRDLSISKVLLPGEDGQPAAILNILIDVTDFKNVERATREARDAAEEASRAKSEFIANISHELRTPLQAIIGFSELGQMQARAQQRLAEMFGDIHNAGQRMLKLVNDLLDVSKIESTVGAIHLEKTDLRGLVRETARELGPLLTSRRQHLDIDLGSQPLVAKVDPMRFQQVIRNLLANAVKFSPAGSRITLDGRHQDGDILLSVRDQGPGIPPAELDAIFEAFVQSSATKDGSGGTGLGLAICRKIVAAHGGRLYAENAPEGGAVFRLALPARSSLETMPAELA